MADEPKHAGGRPLIFDSPEKLLEAITAYFDGTERPTLAGLAYGLGIDRSTLYNYAERDQFFHIIKKARERIEAAYEERLVWDNSPTGTIFALKNMGWKDRNEVAPVDPDGNALKQELTIKIIRDTASSITPGDFTPKSETGTTSSEAV